MRIIVGAMRSDVCISEISTDLSVCLSVCLYMYTNIREVVRAIGN
jgi:hypothetical protein